MKIFSNTVYFLILFFLLPLFSTAQIEQGQWLAGGSLRHINRKVENAASPNQTRLNLELGYLITKRIALGAALGLELERFEATLTHAIWGRYYLMDTPKLSPFTGVRWEKEVERTQRTQNREPSRIDEDRLYLLLGFNYPIHKSLSIEGIYHFGVFRIQRNKFNTMLDEGKSFFDVRLRLLLNSDEEAETFDLNTVFSPGKWMIGGFAEFDPNSSTDRRQFLQANIQPLAARFFLSRLLVGARLNLNYARNIQYITTGLFPFVRYYLPLGANKALFAEASYGYNHIAKKENPKLFISDHEFIRQLGLGYAIFINSRVSLDIMLLQNRTRRFFNFSSLSNQEPFSGVADQVLFNMGLQFFLNP